MEIYRCDYHLSKAVWARKDLQYWQEAPICSYWRYLTMKVYSFTQFFQASRWYYWGEGLDVSHSIVYKLLMEVSGFSGCLNKNIFIFSDCPSFWQTSLWQYSISLLIQPNLVIFYLLNPMALIFYLNLLIFSLFIIYLFFSFPNLIIFSLFFIFF